MPKKLTAEEALLRLTPGGSEFWAGTPDNPVVDVEACLEHVVNQHSRAVGHVKRLVREKNALLGALATLRFVVAAYLDGNMTDIDLAQALDATHEAMATKLEEDHAATDN